MMLLAQVMAGAGFDKVAGGLSKVVDKLGPGGLSLLETPQMQMRMLGASIKDIANATPAMMQIMQLLNPPQPEPPQPPIPGSPQGSPQDLMLALATQLGPGQTGAQLPAGGPPSLGPGGPGGPAGLA